MFCNYWTYPHKTKSSTNSRTQPFCGHDPAGTSWRNCCHPFGCMSSLDVFNFVDHGSELQTWHQSETRCSFQQKWSTSDQTLLYQHLRKENKKLCHIGRKVLCFAVPELFHFRLKQSSFYFKNIQEFVCKLHGNLVHFSEPKSSHLR